QSLAGSIAGGPASLRWRGLILELTVQCAGHHTNVDFNEPDFEVRRLELFLKSRPGHEQDAGVTSAHSRPTAPRVARTRTQAPAGSRLSSLLGSLLPSWTSDQTGSGRCAVNTVPGGGSDASEIA